MEQTALPHFTPSHEDTALRVWQRLELLANLPLLINSSTDLGWIVSCALEQLPLVLDAEWAAVHLQIDCDEVVSWCLGHDGMHQLPPRRLGEGIVAWTLTHRESVCANHGEVTGTPPGALAVTEGSENILCVPLNTRGRTYLGALEVRSHRAASPFTGSDQQFLTQFAAQVALAIENAQLVQSLEQRTRALERLSQKRSDIITMIAHEFRTPLHVIQTAAEMISSRTVIGAEMQRKVATTLSNGVQKLLRLVSEVTTHSLVTSQTLELRLERVAIPDLIEGVLRPLQPVLTARRLACTVELSSSDEIIGTVDPALFSIALRNLLTNAIRFTHDGGAIAVRPHKKGGTLTCAVTDTGIGIPEEHHALIFEKFYEVGSVLNHSSGEMNFQSAGLGIGLATTRAIVEAHGGSISVRSEPGKGSEFTIRIPA